MPSLNHRKVLGFQLVESTSMKIDYIAQNDLEENKETYKLIKNGKKMPVMQIL